MKRYLFTIISCSILCLNLLTSQSKIEFTNPSLEGDVAYSTTPKGWYTCMKNGNSPPDIHTGKRLVWKNPQIPVTGKSYVGLVVRDNGMNEKLSTSLETPLLEGDYYAFAIKLCIPSKFEGKLKTNEVVSFTQPVKFEVWGSNSSCEMEELLYSTDTIIHTQWEQYKCNLNPSKTYKWIHLVANYGSDDAYNGALLLDDLSAIYKTDNLYNFMNEREDVLDKYYSLKNRSKDEASHNVINHYYVQEIIKSGDKALKVLEYDFSQKGKYTICEMDTQRVNVKNGVCKTFNLYTSKLLHQRKFSNGKASKGSFTMNGR